MRQLWQTLMWLFLSLTPAISVAAEPLPRSVLMVAQWDPGLPWYAAVSSAFHATLRAASPEPVAVYAEALDLSRFQSPMHQENFRRHLREKYREKDIGTIVAVGSSALEFILSARSELWPKVPVVFSTVDAATIAQLKLPPDVTGTTIQLTLRDMVAMARVLVPNLKGFALVGEPLEGSSIYRNFKQELPLFTSALELIDLTGLPMTEVKRRVAALPENTAILYTAVFIDGARLAFDPTDALADLAAVANRPIVISTEPQFGRGAVGGLILRPGLVGDDAARLTLRILKGENAANIPVMLGNYSRPIFDWRQLMRWDISESGLPPDSEVRFRQPSLWQQYRLLIIATAAVLLLQAALIICLVFEHRRRGIAEMELRRRVLEVIHLHRAAATGALSASIGHELNQPLGAILSNAETAELLLEAKPLDRDQLKDILSDIRHADQRAAEIIARLPRLLKRSTELEPSEFDLNDAIADAIHVLEPEATKRQVVLDVDPIPRPLPVRADPIHLQQVILNLAINGMHAMENCPPGDRKLVLETALTGKSEVEVSISDKGTGIPKNRLKDIFEMFYTTKQQGTGLGLSIARTIVETYGGKMWAENRIEGGAVFRFTLPLAELHRS